MEFINVANHIYSPERIESITFKTTEKERILSVKLWDVPVPFEYEGLLFYNASNELTGIIPAIQPPVNSSKSLHLPLIHDIFYVETLTGKEYIRLECGCVPDSDVLVPFENIEWVDLDVPVNLDYEIQIRVSTDPYGTVRRFTGENATTIANTLLWNMVEKYNDLWMV